MSSRRLQPQRIDNPNRLRINQRKIQHGYTDDQLQQVVAIAIKDGTKSHAAIKKFKDDLPRSQEKLFSVDRKLVD